MSVDLLRRAAEQIREDASRTEQFLPKSADYNLAVADWLDVASQWSDAGIGGVNMDYAVRVARAYLGEAT